jgi:hypothetical protein
MGAPAIDELMHDWAGSAGPTGFASRMKGSRMLDRRSLLASALCASLSAPVRARMPLFASGAVLSPAIADLASSSALPMHLSDQGAKGPGWDFLRKEAAAADVLLVGEEHGTSEIPALVSALFSERRHRGVDRVVIET